MLVGQDLMQTLSIYILNTTDGDAFTVESKVTLTLSPTTNQQWTNRLVEPDGTGLNSDTWIKSGGFKAKKISVNSPYSGVRTGTVVTTIVVGLNPEQGSIGYGGMHLYTLANGDKILGFAGGNNSEVDSVLRLLNVKKEASNTIIGTASLPPLVDYATNTNDSAEVIFKDMGNSIFQTFYLSTNNGIAATVNSNVLLIELISFKAAIKNNKNTLTLKTASEKNNLGFEIESITDHKQFSKIGFVSKQTTATSNSFLKYSFQDNSAIAGTTYYRLKQMDNDGKFEYFDVKFIKNPFLASQNTFKIYFTTVTSYIDIDGVDSERISVKLFNTSGTEINRILEKRRLNMSDLDAGIYILRISQNGILLQTSKVDKQ